MGNLKNRQNFFVNADESANEEFANFMTDYKGEQYEMATGDAMPDLDVASAFIVKITNTATTAKTDVVIFDAAKQFANSGSNYGLDSALTPSYEIAGLSYGQFLADLLSTNYQIGTMYIESSTSANLTATLKVEDYDVLGNGGYKTLVPKKDAYQQQSTVLEWKTNFILGKNTKMTISSIAASSDVTYSLYSSKANIRPAAKEYVSPQLTRPAAR